jgi:hypothetical protein
VPMWLMRWATRMASSFPPRTRERDLMVRAV